MSEPTSATPAEKRRALRENGVNVGTRGKLSSEAEQQYESLVQQGKA